MVMELNYRPLDYFYYDYYESGFIGEFLYHGAIDVEDLVAGSIQAHDDSAYDFNEDEVEGVLLLWDIIIIIITLLLIVFFVYLSPF